MKLAVKVVIIFDLMTLSIIILMFLLINGYVGYVAWRRTKNADDYLVAGRKIHPSIMAISHGATFISTAAIVGLGGVDFFDGFDEARGK